MDESPDDFVQRCRAVTAKRARTVIDHILQHGHITTDELKTLYGYNHPPRAARDVIEHGIPLIMYRVEGPDGRKIAAYRFGDPSSIGFRRLSGRTALAKALKRAISKSTERSALSILNRCRMPNSKSTTEFPTRSLAIWEHKNHPNSCFCAVPLIGPNRDRANTAAIGGSYTNLKIGRACYWAYPESYTHVAMEEIRRLDVIWRGQEVTQYEDLRRAAISSGDTASRFVKNALRRILKDRE
jgi:hypothetical protein